MVKLSGRSHWEYGVKIVKQARESYNRGTIENIASCSFRRIPSAVRLHFLTSRARGMVSSTSYFHQGRCSLFLSRSFSPLLLPSLLPSTYILSFSAPLDGITFHPSRRSSFRCKVHTWTQLRETVGREGLLLFLYDLFVALKIRLRLACNLRQKWMTTR